MLAEQQQTSSHIWLIEEIDRKLQVSIRNRLERYFVEAEKMLAAGTDYRSWVINHRSLDLLALYNVDGERLFPAENQTALIKEIRSLKKISNEISLLFNGHDLSTPYQALIHDSSGLQLLACKPFRQQVVCLFFNKAALIEWGVAAFNELQLPPGLMISISITRLNSILFSTLLSQAEAATPLSVLAEKSMRGVFEPWLIQLHGIQTGEKLSRPLLLVMIVSPVLLLLFGCGYGIYRIEQLQQQQIADQKSFSAELAHEIRNPLANIRLYIELLKQHSNNKQDSYCSIMVSEIERLSMLVDNAILLVQPQVSQRTDYYQLSEPDELIKTTVKTLTPSLDENSCQVVCQLSIEQKRMYDQDALQRVLINLLDNSRKYAKGALIQVSSRLVGSTIRIEYYDEGGGVSEAVWRNAVDQKGKRNTLGGQGFGLGLRVCVRLCRRSGGQLDYSRNHAGAHFIITLPSQEEMEQ